MATHPSAEKRHRQNQKRRAANRNARSTIRTTMKKAKALAAEGQKEEAQSAVVKATSLIDKAVVHGVLHKKTAQRTISRLQVAINKS